MASLSVKGSRGHLLVFAPGGRGGGQRHTDLLAEILIDRGWRVVMIVRQTDDHRFRLRRSSHLLRLELPGFGNGRFGVAMYIATGLMVSAPWVRRARVALALQLPWPATAAAVAGRVYGIPFIVFTISSGESSDVAALRRGRSSGLLGRLVGRAAFVVAQTEGGAREAAGLSAPGTIAVVPNPVKRSRAPLQGTPTAAYAGRLDPAKDVGTLIEAWRALVDQRPDARLLIAGAGGRLGSTEGQIRASVAADPRLRSTVTLLGWVDEIGTVLTSCDLFIFPSRSEGMSNALLEAMAYGRVIVASDIAANRAVVGDSYPYLFPVGDAASLATAIRRAMTDDDVRQIALQQLESRLNEFSPQHVGTMIEDLIGAAGR